MTILAKLSALDICEGPGYAFDNPNSSNSKSTEENKLNNEKTFYSCTVELTYKLNNKTNNVFEVQRSLREKCQYLELF